MAVTIQLPSELEQRLRAESANLDAEATEALALDLFRRGKLSHSELSRVLGLDRFQTDAYLKQHHVFDGAMSHEDLDHQRQSLERFLGPADK